ICGCRSDSDCSGPTPACQPAGSANPGVCGECSMTNKSLCGGPRPVCNTNVGSCGPCTSDSDCGGVTPACQPLGTANAGACGECSTTNASLCIGMKPVCSTNPGLCAPCASDADCTNPALPACQPLGTANAGACGECSTTNASLCIGMKPVCSTNPGLCAPCAS